LLRFPDENSIEVGIVEVDKRNVQQMVDSGFVFRNDFQQSIRVALNIRFTVGLKLFENG